MPLSLGMSACGDLWGFVVRDLWSDGTGTLLGICGQGICGQTGLELCWGFVVRDLWSGICGQGFVVRRDWNFAKSGQSAATFQRLYRSEDPAKRSSQTKWQRELTFDRQQTLVFLSDSPAVCRREEFVIV
jgi:hypothetical protein